MILKFTFQQPDDPEVLADSIAWATLMAEFVYGKETVRLEAGYSVAEDGRACVLRVDGAAGETAAKIFTGLASLRLGEDAFMVEHVKEAARAS